MTFDEYRTEEEALASFGCTGEPRSPRKTLYTLATNKGEFSIQMRQIESVTILDMNGRFVLETANAFREEMKLLLAAHKKILVNFENVTFIDSRGFGYWMSAHQVALLAGVKVKYILNNCVREIIQVMRLY